MFTKLPITITINNNKHLIHPSHYFYSYNNLTKLHTLHIPYYPIETIDPSILTEPSITLNIPNPLIPDYLNHLNTIFHHQYSHLFTDYNPNLNFTLPYDYLPF